MFRTIDWNGEAVVMLDQTRLPSEVIYRRYERAEDVAGAIRTMVIRGAPAIGVAAAMGIALGIKDLRSAPMQDLEKRMAELSEMFAATRPTAVNLFWAIERMRRVFAAARASGAEEAVGALIREALAVRDEDVEMNRRMGRHGEILIPQEACVLTHCNAGALATAGYGTALGVVRAAVEKGKKVRVLADETRPFLQGARLTAWELAQDGIPVTLITDSAAGHFLSRGEVDLAIVGADRIAANGDVANKIGTYSVAVLAKENDIPFYVAAPLSTIDLSLATGKEIPIEERDPQEVKHAGVTKVAPDEVAARHPAFDVTPARYVTAIITEAGIARAPYETGLKALFEIAGRC
ncbi:MAG TPA: S-methyl-5-thioribose-1-phosphate isomerase [Candidatus Polarisedimenticolia bacterium]|jgi:methylthioribose-1-phosphate isomerase|nr:S-methyl-5-thioribose-1-phosphate isomerase [Candidatus Polarisedimenticolia bacterium]